MLPDNSLLFWITAVTAVILVGVAKAGFGGGVGIIATPLMALTIPVAEAAALLLPLLIVIDFITVRHYWRQYDGPSLRLLLPSATVGIVLGGLFFSAFEDNERILKIGIGVLALLFIAYQAGRALLLGVLEKHRPARLVGAVLGISSGFISTLAHAGGPPVTIYLLPQQLPRRIFVGTNIFLFMAINLIKLVPYGFLGLLRIGNLTTILILSPLCFVGVRVGLYLNGRFTDIWFNRLIYVLLLLTGLQLVTGQNLLTWFLS
jgi:uncharacterized membrane protein YfcA